MFILGLTIIMDVLILTEILGETYLYCTLTFVAVYLPSICGSFLTLLISIIRYLSTKKSAKNIQIENKTILKWSIFSFALFILCFDLYITVNEIMVNFFKLFLRNINKSLSDQF